MSALDQIVNVNIAVQAATVSTPSFALTAIFGNSNRFAPGVSTTGNITSGSNLLKSIASMTGVVPGAKVSATGIPAGTYVLSVSGTTVTLSANASATTTAVPTTFTDVIRAYAGGQTGLAAMVADGFLVTDPEYIRAEELIEQALVPPSWFVASNSASVAQVDTIAVATAVMSHPYVFSLNGTVISYTSTDTTQQDILNGLLTAIGTAFPSGAPVTGAVSGTGMSALLTLTSSVPGQAVTYTAVDVDLTHSNTTVNHSIVTDIQQAQLQNDTWYGTAICSNTDGDLEQVGAYTETQFKIFGGVTNTAAVATSSTTDVASIMGSKSYKRTFLVFTNEPTEGKEAAWLGGQLPSTPGSSNWAYKKMAGCTPDQLSTSQQQALIGIPETGISGKNVNIYQIVGGAPITQMGWMIGGQFIDVTVGVDWLKSTIQTNIFQLLATQPKIPYTDIGVASIIQQVRAAIDQGILNELIDGTSPITITAQAVATVAATQRQQRVSPTINFSCRLAGALNAVVVNGTLTQ